MPILTLENIKILRYSNQRITAKGGVVSYIWKRTYYLKSTKANTVKAMTAGIMVMLGIMTAGSVQAAADTQPTSEPIVTEAKADTTFTELDNGYTYIAEDGSKVIINDTVVESDSDGNVIGMTSSATRMP